MEEREERARQRFPNASDVWEARKRIAPYVRRTPLVFSHRLSEISGAEVYLKLENLQEVGAFKIRGAANRVLSLSEEERRRGVTTYSTGNHAQAVACISGRLGVRAVVCVSDRVPKAKLDAIRRWGAELRIARADLSARELGDPLLPDMVNLVEGRIRAQIPGNA